MILDILLGTPAWVFLLLAVLVWLGACQLSARAVPVQRIWRTPLLFIIWGLFGVVMHNTGALTSLLPWLVAASAGLLGGMARSNTLEIDHARGIVLRPASIIPLLRNLIVFAAHYALNVAAAFHPDRHAIMQVDMAISGALAGFFVGWLIRFIQHHRESAALHGAPVPANP